jgi:hypothetical protein
LNEGKTFERFNGGANFSPKPAELYRAGVRKTFEKHFRRAKREVLTKYVEQSKGGRILRFGAE